MANGVQEKPLTQESENLWVLLGLTGLASAAYWLSRQKPVTVLTCPPGYKLNAQGECQPISTTPPGTCPTGTTGTYPNCVPITTTCPTGYHLSGGVCVADTPPPASTNVAVSVATPQFTAKAGDYITLTFTIKNNGTTPASVIADGLSDQTQFVWNTGPGQHVLPPGNSGLQAMYADPVTIAPGASQTFSFKGQVSTDKTNFAFTVPLLATTPGSNGPGVILAEGSVQITIPAASTPPPVTCPTGYHLSGGVCVPNSSPPPPTTTTLLAALQPSFTVPIGRRSSIGLWLKNTGAVTATGLVFTCAFPVDQIASDIAWAPTPYVGIQGNVAGIVLPDLAPGAIWTGAFQFDTFALAQVGMIAQATAANAPASIAETLVTIGGSPSGGGAVNLAGAVFCDGSRYFMDYGITINDGQPTYLIISAHPDFSTHDFVIGPFTSSVNSPVYGLPGVWYAQLNRYAFLGPIVQLTLPMADCQL